MKRLYQLMIVTLLLLAINFVGHAADDYPVTVTDDLGRQVTITHQPERIVSLAPSVTETLYELNLEDKIVGVTKFCNYPSQAQEKEKVSSENIESIIAQKPDVVIAAGIVPQKVIQRLQDLNIKIVGYKANSISEAITIIEKIARISGSQNRGTEVVKQMKAELAALRKKVQQRLAARDEKPTVFYEVWKKPLRTASSNTFINDLITTAGGKNIAAEAKGNWPQYSLEQLLIKNPAVYIATTGSWKNKVTAAKIKKRPNYRELNAIKNDRVYVFNADIINRPGPRLIKGLKLFVKAIHPQVNLAD